MNGFEQIKGFYSWVFNHPEKIRPTHISLYLFLWNQSNRANWADWVKIPYDLAMQGACIGNNGTYYKCLDELKSFGLIDYTKGINNYKAPLVHLIQLYDNEQLSEQVTVPQSEQLTAQQYAQLTAQLPVHIYKLITNNLQQITDNYLVFEKFVNSLSVETKVSPPTQKTLVDRKNDFRLKVIEILRNERPQYYNEKDENKLFFEYWSEHSEKGKKMRFEKEKVFDFAARLDRWHRKSESKKQIVYPEAAEPESKTARMLREIEESTLEAVKRIEAEELLNQ